VPSFATFFELNSHLTERCADDLDRRTRGNRGTKAERLEEDLGAMHRLPGASFEPKRVEARRANSLSLVRFDQNYDSVPTAFAHHEVVVSGGIEQISISSGPEVVATHRRDWGREHTTYDPRHYLALLERKPGHWTSPGRSRHCSCRVASRICAGASRPTSARWGPVSSSRCCDS
jgi:hypothetical protein